MPGTPTLSAAREADPTASAAPVVHSAEGTDAANPTTGTAAHLALATTLLRRDLLRLRRDTGRWVGLVLQPLLLWALLGSGFGAVFQVPGLPGVDYHRFFFPGLVVMIGLFTAIFSTMAVIEDRDHGFLQQVLVAPGSRAAMVAGKVLGVLAIALFQLVLVLPASTLAGYSLGELDYPLLVSAFILGTIGTTSLAFSLAWLCPTTHAYHALMGVLLIPLWLISGAMFPLPSEGWLAVVAAANPMTYALDGLRHGFEGGSSAMATTAPALTMLILLAYATLAFALAVFVARARKTSKAPATGASTRRASR